MTEHFSLVPDGSSAAPSGTPQGVVAAERTPWGQPGPFVTLAIPAAEPLDRGLAGNSRMTEVDRM